jgi:hypothetical protein
LGQSEKGFYTYTSPDGFEWARLSPDRIALHHLAKVPKTVPDANNIIGYYDERRGMHVAFPKIMAIVGGFYRRSYRVMYSHDFVSWSEPQLVLTADPRDDAGMLWRIEQSRSLIEAKDEPSLMRTEFYGLGIYPAESCTVAFLWILMVNNKAVAFPRNQDGPGELQMAFSRDLVDWHRPFRTPCVRRDDMSAWDRGFFMSAARAPARRRRGLAILRRLQRYTWRSPIFKADGTGRGTTAKQGIGIAIWKLDRFVSADGPREGGVLTTVPVLFGGDRL